MSDTYVNHSERFLNVSAFKRTTEAGLLELEKVFMNQYFQMYNDRTAKTRPRLELLAANHWPGVPLSSIPQLVVGKESILIGLLCKQIALKSSALKALDAEDKFQDPAEEFENYVSENDNMVLQDEYLSITLSGLFPTSKTVSGIICAVRGKMSSSHVVHVEDWIWATPELPDPRQTSITRSESDHRYLALISGFNICEDSDDMLEHQLLADLLSLKLGDLHTQATLSGLVRVVVTGNSLGAQFLDGDFDALETCFTSKRKKTSSSDGLREIDVWLSQIRTQVEVDLMPGEKDPTNSMLPYQPLHPCLFPLATSRQKTTAKSQQCNLVSSPYDFELCGRRILGTSGENVRDVMAYTNIDDCLEALISTLQWGHLCPSAPDTLGCQPLQNDPFMVTQYPNIYFAGNQKHFQMKKINHGPSETLIVSLPCFSVTRSFVLVDLDAMAAEEVNIVVGDDD